MDGGPAAGWPGYERQGDCQEDGIEQEYGRQVAHEGAPGADSAAPAAFPTAMLLAILAWPLVTGVPTPPLGGAVLVGGGGGGVALVGERGRGAARP